MLRTVLAQVNTTQPDDPLAGRFPNLAAVFGLIINIVIGVGIALTVIFLVIGGIRYITSGGDPKAADAARASLTNAVIGFVIVLAALTIRILVGNILETDAGTFTITNVSPI